MAPRRPADPLEGTSYRRMGVLGRGSMGEVLLAEHRQLGRKACVKLLLPDVFDVQGLADRFRVEAQALALLGGGNHPNLVHVLDFGLTPAGAPYLVMEYLEGRTLLDERKERGAIPWREAVDIVTQALAGVEVAHEAGIVHRDLKPANLFLARGRGGVHVKVLDFGIIKILRSSAPVLPGAPTATGYLLGTPRYAAPEQVRGEGVDERTDVYAMGLVLWELLTGLPPYPLIRSVDQLCIAQVRDPIPAPSTEAAQNIPRSLDGVVLRAASKDPSERFADAREMRAALTAVVTAGSRNEQPAAEDHDTEPFHLEAPPEPATGDPPDTVPAKNRATVPLPTLELASPLRSPPERERVPSSSALSSSLPPNPRGVSFIAVTILSTLLFAGVGWWLIARFLL